MAFGRRGLYPSLLYLINFQEVLSIERNVSKEVNWVFLEGKRLADAYRESLGNERAMKKVETLSYRLLEAIRRKDANHFSQNLIRAYLEVGKPIPPVFLKALTEGGLEKIAYAFLIGLNGEEGELEPEGEAKESMGQEWWHYHKRAYGPTFGKPQKAQGALRRERRKNLSRAV